MKTSKMGDSQGEFSLIGNWKQLLPQHNRQDRKLVTKPWSNFNTTKIADIHIRNESAVAKYPVNN